MTDVAGPLHPRGDGPEGFQPVPISFPPEVMNLVQTCECHPSQWEGWTSDGGVIYVRFRHGRLWIGLAPDYRRTAQRRCSSLDIPAKTVTMATFVTRPSSA